MDIFFSNVEKLLGYVETDSGSVLLTDGLWEKELPNNSQERLALDLGIEQSKIPVYGILLREKRYLLISLDDAVSTRFNEEHIDTEDPVPEEEEKNDSETAEKERTSDDE
jgi:hypothetical protein